MQTTLNTYAFKKDIIKTGLRETGRGLDWIHQVQDSVQWYKVP